VGGVYPIQRRANLRLLLHTKACIFLNNKHCAFIRPRSVNVSCEWSRISMSDIN
jgi:hypothetical protein